jgi:hypothetical protein
MLTLRQVDSIVHNTLLIFKGFEIERREEGTNIFYYVHDSHESSKRFLGIYRVWEWHDGSGRSGWMPLNTNDAEVTRIRDAVWEAIMAIDVPANLSREHEVAQSARIDQENITLGELEQRVHAGDKEAIEFWEEEISPLFEELRQALIQSAEKSFENDPSRPFFEMIKTMSTSENPIHRAIIQPYGKWSLKKIKEQGRKLLQVEIAKSAKNAPFAGLIGNSTRQVAINTTSVIAGSEYDNLPLKELKHKAARFDAICYRNMDAQATQLGMMAMPKEPPQPPELKKNGGKISLWLDWYHSMRDKGFKCTLKDVASKSGYSLGYIKQRHMVYQAKPNQNT